MWSSDVSRRVTSAAQQVQSGKFERGGREVKISIDQQDGITRHHQDCNPIPLLGSWYIQHHRFPQDFDSLHVNKMWEDCILANRPLKLKKYTEYLQILSLVDVDLNQNSESCLFFINASVNLIYLLLTPACRSLVQHAMISTRDNSSDEMVLIDKVLCL